MTYEDVREEIARRIAYREGYTYDKLPDIKKPPYKRGDYLRVDKELYRSIADEILSIKAGNYTLKELIEREERANEEVEDIIEDGFGSAWSAYCPECGEKTMSVVRPGKAQCCNCG